MSLPISGFTAVPNPQMLAFMAAQSFIMMMQAGEGWQYGKRKQSAMTNEVFNEQTVDSIMERQMNELKAAIPTIEKSMNAMTPMIRTIVIQYGDFMKEIIRALPKAIIAAQGGQTLEGNISTVGQEFADILKNLIPSIKEAHASSTSTNASTNTPDTTLFNLSEAELSGSEFASAENVLAFRAAQEEKERKRLAAIPSSKTLSAAEDPVYIAWITKLGKLKADFQTNQTTYNSLKNPNITRSQLEKNKRAQAWSKMFGITSQIRQMSNDYRNPNNHIRENALRLRRNMSQWTRKR